MTEKPTKLTKMSGFEKKSKNAGIVAMLNMKADNDELMEHFRELAHQREELAERLEMNNYECDILTEVFSCTVKEEFVHLVEEFFPVQQSIPPIQAEEDALIQRVNILNSYEAQRHLGVGIRRLDSKTLIIEFVTPANYTPSDLSLIKLEKNENTYKLIHTLLPVSIPFAELEKKYLENVNNQDVPAFIHSIHQYLWCFWKRDIEVQNVKNAEYMKDSNIYHNRNLTVISFTAHFLMKYLVEMKLLFDPLSYIAYSADYQVQDEKPIPSDLVEALIELKNALRMYPLSAVLHTNFTSDDEESSKQQETASSVTESSSTLFDIFK